MKVEKIDYIWSVLATIAVGVTFHYGFLLYGLVGIFLSLVVVMFLHIAKVRSQLQGTVAAYALITGYQREKGVTPHYYPMVTFETEEGRTVDSIYSVAASKEIYETGSEQMICYAPEDPMFFYFADRESDFTGGYYKIMIFAIIGALTSFIIAQVLAG